MKAVVLSLVVLGTATAAGAQTTYHVSELGAGCTPSSINAPADVAGQCDGVATRWQDGVAFPLGVLAAGQGSIAESVNAAGVAVGYAYAADGRPRAVLFRNGDVRDIDPSAANAYAVHIDSMGVVVGNALKGFGNCNSWVPAIWTEQRSKAGEFRRTDLEPYPGGDGKARCAFAEDANELMEVVGWVQNSLFGQYGAFWANDDKHTLSLLYPYAGDWSSLAWAVNDAGQAVGESHPPFSSRPVLWQNDGSHTAVALPFLPGDNYGAAVAVNNLGHAVGSSAYAVPGTWNVGPRRPVLWRDGGVFELQSLLDPTSGSGWILTNVSAINDEGQIVGLGLHDGRPVAFILTPTTR